jgi:hypothetical protein
MICVRILRRERWVLWAAPGRRGFGGVLEWPHLFSGNAVMPPECQLFGTLGCHLCEVAEAELMPFVEHGLLVELVDIAEDESWFEKYSLRIPVLRRIDTGAELDWPFSADQVVAFLR